MTGTKHKVRQASEHVNQCLAGLVEINLWIALSGKLKFIAKKVQKRFALRFKDARGYQIFPGFSKVIHRKLRVVLEIQC